MVPNELSKRDALPKRGAAESPYRAWQAAEGIPTYRGSSIGDVHHVDVTPWARTGQKGAFINLADQEHDDAYVIEVEPGGKTEVLHHIFEAGVVVLAGHGATSFWQRDTARQTVEWQPGSLFAPPLNCHYQHFNLSGTDPARLLVVTNAPMVINLFRNTDYVFHSEYVFSDRYQGEEDYFADHGYRDGSAWKTNFVPDLRTFRLQDYRTKEARGVGNASMSFALSNNQMAAGVSLFPVGTYKKAHRHGVGAHILILQGEGFSMLWSEGEEACRVDWTEGSLISPREREYHQHFNTGPRPAMYLKFRLGNLDSRHYEGFEPDQIEYEFEDPSVYERYADECARHGADIVLRRPAYVGAP